MKTVQYLMLALLVLGFTPGLRAQTFTNLHSFSATSGVSPYTNGDGASPAAGLVLSGETLFGAAGNGGSAGNGNIFAINTDGKGFTNLYNFTTTSGASLTNSDGANPFASLILSGITLYGTAFDGGTNGLGTVFSVNTNGRRFTNLHTFTDGTNGGNPASSLVLLGDALYGTAELGGKAGDGMVFRVYTNGTGFTNLHGFTGGKGGSFPQAGLVLSGNTLYGTTSAGGMGGNGGNGTVFAINTDGTGFTNIYRFTGSNDGSFPDAGLIISGDTLYGTTEFGGNLDGSEGDGTVFSLNTNGAPFAVLHTFTATDPDTLTNSDGANPAAGLILLGNTLYGVTDYGGSQGAGTVFSVDTSASNFANLHSFAGGSGGSGPSASLIFAGQSLYGTAEFDGSGGAGTVFGLAVGTVGAPQPDILSVTVSGMNLVINANNGQSGGTYKTLQSPSLALPLNQWTPVATNILSASGDFTITATNVVNTRVAQRFYILETQ
jgi:uncharacterized repeat protein (TIGR03803 family)